MSEVKKPKVNVKKFKLSEPETQKIQTIQSVMGIHAIEREAMLDKMYMEIARIKNRMNINAQAPEGFTRSTDFDTEKWEIIVTDTEIVKESKPVEEKKDEAKLVN